MRTELPGRVYLHYDNYAGNEDYLEVKWGGDTIQIIINDNEIEIFYSASITCKKQASNCIKITRPKDWDEKKKTWVPNENYVEN